MAFDIYLRFDYYEAPRDDILRAKTYSEARSFDLDKIHHASECGCLIYLWLIEVFSLDDRVHIDTNQGESAI